MPAPLSVTRSLSASPLHHCLPRRHRASRWRQVSEVLSVLAWASLIPGLLYLGGAAGF